MNCACFENVLLGSKKDLNWYSFAFASKMATFILSITWILNIWLKIGGAYIHNFGVGHVLTTFSGKQEFAIGEMDYKKE